MIQDRNFQILAKFKQGAEELGASQFAAVATAVFRKAANGAYFLNRVRNELGIPVDITSQVGSMISPQIHELMLSTTTVNKNNSNAHIQV